MLLKRLQNNGVSRLCVNELQIQVKEQIDNKIFNKEYQFESINCPICNSNEKDIIGEKDRYGLYFPTNLCKECGLVYTSPRMNQESYNSFYNLEYRKLYSGSDTVSTHFFNYQRKFGKRIFNFLLSNRLLKSQMFVLEVGCGAGGIIDYFKEQGHIVKGIDLGEQYVNYGKENYGLDLEIGTLKDISLDKKPNLIIYSHVLEHILDINEEINQIKNIINDNTILYIEVPGIKEIHNNYKYDILRYFQNAHTFHFSLESLTNIMNKHGFDLICGNQFIMSAFKFNNTNKNRLNDYKAVKKYIVKVELKRSLIEKFLYLRNNLKSLLFKFLHFTNTYRYAKKVYNYFLK